MNTSPTRITVHSPTDILDVVPTLLGFIPTESLVIIYLDTVDCHARIAMTARMDLPTSPSELTAELQIIKQHAHAHATTMLVAYSVDSALAGSTLLRVLRTITGIEIKVAISASAEGWAEVSIDEPIHRFPYSRETSAVTAEMAAAGLQHTKQTRDDLEQTIAPRSRSEASRFAGLLAESERLDSAQLTAWLERWMTSSPGQTLHVAEAASLVASVQDIQVRDPAWAAISSAHAELHIDLWRQAARLVDGSPALPVLGLLGMAAWIGGQGALANLVLDRAERVGCDHYSLFELLHTVLQRAINPRDWDSLRDTIMTTTNEGTATA